MIALDTSIVVAAFGSWHENHALAVSRLRHDAALTAHTALEAYSVLTRLPEPFRADPGVVAEFLRQTFPRASLTLSPAAQRALPGQLSRLGITGGRAYDALIALTARAAGARLLTLDARALATYASCEVEAELIVD